mmetsp:Transcript_32988/g.42393  ORF Transcript_32988/g.42393 Transcript_32988/m.42393 type:complete len:376 (+) Transcript_32988:142-1269(+)
MAAADLLNIPIILYSQMLNDIDNSNLWNIELNSKDQDKEDDDVKHDVTTSVMTTLLSNSFFNTFHSLVSEFKTCVNWFSTRIYFLDMYEPINKFRKSKGLFEISFMGSLFDGIFLNKFQGNRPSAVSLNSVVTLIGTVFGIESPRSLSASSHMIGPLLYHDTIKKSQPNIELTSSSSSSSSSATTMSTLIRWLDQGRPVVIVDVGPWTTPTPEEIVSILRALYQVDIHLDEDGDGIDLNDEVEQGHNQGHNDPTGESVGHQILWIISNDYWHLFPQEVLSTHSEFNSTIKLVSPSCHDSVSTIEHSSCLAASSGDIEVLLSHPTVKLWFGVPSPVAIQRALFYAKPVLLFLRVTHKYTHAYLFSLSIYLFHFLCI